MKVLFRIRGGRWSAVVRRVESGTFGDPDLDLDVKIFCGRVQIMCFGFCPAQKRTADTGRGPSVLDYAELFEFRLSEVDRKDLRYLMRVTGSLCQCLHDGKSVEHWCAARGRRPVREIKYVRNRKRPSPLVIRARKTFVLPARRSSRPGRRPRGRLAR